MKRSSMREALDNAGVRPPDSEAAGAKRRYAELLSHAIAQVLCRDLAKRHKRFSTIRPGESQAGSASGTKKIDANLSTAEYGLELGVSIKTISHRDKNGAGRYTKNRKRVDEEFLAEAMAYHVRQPYAVLFGLYFLPIDSCDDGHGRWPSSFGAWVEKHFYRARREGPKDNPELFERMLIGLVDSTGDAQFFDVANAPPMHGRPRPEDLWTWDEMLDQIHLEYVKRNAGFKWFGASDAIAPSEIEPDSPDEDNSDDE